MSEQDDNHKEYMRALAYLKAGAQANGVCAIKMADGEMFMFSKDMVYKLKENVDSGTEDAVLVFVKTGPELQES